MTGHRDDELSLPWAPVLIGDVVVDPGMVGLDETTATQDGSSQEVRASKRWDLYDAERTPMH